MPIVLAESAEDLQVQLNAFGEYCDNWKMKVNVNKTKIIVFGFGKLRQNLKYTY
jgi:CRISPR/Cas system CSM-associated protein Csm2 small subunit